MPKQSSKKKSHSETKQRRSFLPELFRPYEDIIIFVLTLFVANYFWKWSMVGDENGDMVREYSSDGVHLKAQYIPLWKEYLLEHAVVLPDPAE
jgi:hypothetical protein